MLNACSPGTNPAAPAATATTATSSSSSAARRDGDRPTPPGRDGTVDQPGGRVQAGDGGGGDHWDGGGGGGGGGGLPSLVRLRVEPSVILALNAFRARLDILNPLPAPVTDLYADLYVETPKAPAPRVHHPGP